MEKSTFNSKIASPYTYTLREKLDIQAEKTRFPYCALLQQMDLLSDKAASIYQWESRFVSKVALYMLDASKLVNNLNDVSVIDISSPEDLKLKQQIESTKRQEYECEEPAAYDVMSEINAYQDVSFKTAPKSVILSNFLKEEGGNTSELGAREPQSIAELAKKSISSEDSVETETMAVIFEKQGKLDKAVAIYEKLMVKYPEKSSTFATRISDLKKKIDNK